MSGARRGDRARVRDSRPDSRRAAQVERRVPRRPDASASDPAHARRHRARAVHRMGRTAACGSSRTSTRRSRIVTSSSSRTSSTPGSTLHFLCRTLGLRNPASLAAVTLLDRPYRRLVDELPLRFVGFTVPDELFAGYGLGLDERWRALPDLHLVSSDRASAARRRKRPEERLEVEQRVDGDAVDSDLEVQVRPRRVAGRADERHGLPLRDRLPDPDEDRRCVGVGRREPVAVIDDDEVAVAAEPARRGSRCRQPPPIGRADTHRRCRCPRACGPSACRSR